MRDHSFHLEPSLFAPTIPLRYEFVPQPPWGWTVRDAANTVLATAKTRAGARAATRWIYLSTAREPGPVITTGASQHPILDAPNTRIFPRKEAA